MLLAHGGSAASPWAWHAHPDVWALVVVLAGGYWWAARRRFPGSASRRQLVLFSLGLALLWVHADWPVHDISEKYLFFVHMLQHTGFQLVAVPLLLLGLPAPVFRRLFSWLGPLRVAKPLPAALVFNAVTVVTHWPVVVNASIEVHSLHFVVHVVLFGAAVLMWLPVLNLGRAPALPALRGAGRMVYLFVQSILPTVPASFLTFADSPVYRVYAEAVRPFALSAVDDQQLAGALMKVYAGSLLWLVIAVMFFRWYAEDEKGGDVLRWDDVEREFARSPAPSSSH